MTFKGDDTGEEQSQVEGLNRNLAEKRTTMQMLVKYVLLLCLSLLAEVGIAADAAPSEIQRREPGYLGEYEELVARFKKIYSLEAESASKLTTRTSRATPIIAIENWSAGYVAMICRENPGYRDFFKKILTDTLGAYKAMAEKNLPTESQLAAVSAMREFAGDSSEQVERFADMLVRADALIVVLEKLEKDNPNF